MFFLYPVFLKSNVTEGSSEDFEMLDSDYQEMLDHIGEEARIVGVACDMGDQEFNYYDIEFNDGFEIEAIQGHHLEF